MLGWSFEREGNAGAGGISSSVESTPHTHQKVVVVELLTNISDRN
jgi:hypothetical protein